MDFMMAKFGIVDLTEAERLAFVLKNNAYSNGALSSRYGYTSDEAKEAREAADSAMDNLLDALKGTMEIETAEERHNAELLNRADED